MKKNLNQGFAQVQAGVKGSTFVTQDAVLSEDENIARTLQLGPSLTRQCPDCKHWFKQDPNCGMLWMLSLIHCYLLLWSHRRYPTQICNHLTLKMSIRRTSH